MQIMTSYFYQIRNFTPNMIPLSTAMWDPKWFHQNKGQKYQFKDKNGVWNGLRAEPFVPGPLCNHLCRGPEFCHTKDPACCPFLKKYREQLDRLDINNILNRVSFIGNQIQQLEGFTEEPIIVFIVHEAPQNLCSERIVIQQWFRDNDVCVQEFVKK